MKMTFNPLDEKKTAVLNLGVDMGSYCPGPYLKPGTAVTFKLESRQQELAILGAYDYGLDALSEEGKAQIHRLLADLKVAITGR